MERKTKISEVYAHVHKKILKLESKSSFYMFCNRKMVTLNHMVGQLLLSNEEEDGILYLIYA